MAEPADRFPKPPRHSLASGFAKFERPVEDDERTMSHDANAQLILLRLADEERTNGWRKWWRAKP